MYDKREALIKRRNQLGLSLRGIAKQLGIPLSTYRSIENGVVNLSIEMCNNFKRVLGVNPFVFMSRIKYDLNIYDKNEPLKLIWIFVSMGGDCINMLRVEDSHGEKKDLTLDEFSNILYYRYINQYSLNITYKAHGSEELKLIYVKDKSQSLLNWCLENGELGQEIIHRAETELHYGITLADFYKNSNKKIKLKCPKHGIYEHVIGSITQSRCGCPKCSAHGTSYPEQFIYWSMKQLYKNAENRYKINGLEIDVFIPENNTCIEYNGYTWHESKEYMDLQKRNHIKSLGYNFITINEHKEKIDTTLNGNEIDTYYDYRNKNEWLKGLVMLILKEILHDDKSSLIDFKAVEENAWEYSKGKLPYEKSVAYLFPELTKEWDSSNFIKPEDITPGSHQRIKFICTKCRNKWTVRVTKRAYSKSGCTSCGYNILTNKINTHGIRQNDSVLKMYPELDKEYIPELNEGKQLENYTAGSKAKITWKCKNCGNEWATMIKSRTHQKSGCHSCGYNVFIDKINIRSIKQNDSVLKTYPELAKEFLPELNEGKQLEDYTAGSNVKITWKCTNCGNEWTTEIRNRTRDKSGCSTCGYNVFIDKINPHGIYHKKQPIAVVNGVEVYL